MGIFKMDADLHLHTHFSDGTYTPEALARSALRLGIAALAVTDHDTVEACESCEVACRAAGIEFVPGIELTTEWEGQELHFLGYGIDVRHGELLAELAQFQDVRQQRVRQMVDRLNHLRVPLEADAVFALADCRSPGRPHIARALVQAGRCGSMDEAFDRYLKKGRPAWVPKRRMSAGDCIGLLHRAGGVAVLAHPGLCRPEAPYGALADAGLDGIECYHSKHDGRMVQRCRAIAERHGWLITGGSDCHGDSKGRPVMGTVRLPYEHFVALKSRIPAAHARIACSAETQATRDRG